jgi:hypothetical protein
MMSVSHSVGGIGGSGYAEEYSSVVHTLRRRGRAPVPDSEWVLDPQFCLAHHEWCNGVGGTPSPVGASLDEAIEVPVDGVASRKYRKLLVAPVSQIDRAVASNNNNALSPSSTRLAVFV